MSGFARSQPVPGHDAPPIGTPLAAALLVHCRGGDVDVIRATIERLCRDRADGHVCLRLPDLAGTPRDVDLELRDAAADASGRSVALPEASTRPGPGAWPRLDAWTATLRQSGLCGDGAAGAGPSPMVLDGAGRLYLRRDFVAERTIRDWLLPRLRPCGIEPAAVAATLRALRMSAPPAGGAPDWQLAAVVAAVRAPFVVVTGGPGTGKTTTVARLLGVLRHLEPGLRIALAAPTGKAAARLGEALQQRAAEHPGLRELAATLTPKTLHRLLGYLPLDDSFRAGPDRPLPYDVVVVDEASMIDPALLAVLCRALPAAARLVLVGDRDQLAAVAAGQVLGDLCRAARPERGVGPELAAFVAEAVGTTLPVQAAASPLASCVIALRVNHRSGQQPGIGAFAHALASREPANALAALQHGHADLVLARDPDDALRALAPALLAAAAAATGAASPASALAALARVRVLTASRHGPAGAAAWNRRVEELLARAGHRVDAPWYPGRPVLITANDHQNRLWNGDLGVVLVDADGRAAVWFTTADGSPRAVPPLRLPAHETAWAMTVHKAQGSEFDEVLVTMPERDGPLWQASLLYTAVTRAKRRAVLLAEPALLAQALARWPERASGLADALAGGAVRTEPDRVDQ